MSNESLITKLKNKTAVIGIVGLGYTGLPLLLRYSSVGYPTIGFEIDQVKVESLNQGRSYIQHISSTAVAEAITNGLMVTADFERVASLDAMIICVPTPLTIDDQPDTSFIVNAIDLLAPYIKPGQAVSLESTSYPGTTDEIIKPRIEAKNLVIGKDVFLVFSPEREDPGNPDFKTKDIPKICGGVTSSCLEVGVELYRNAIDKVVPVSSTRAAEMTKLMENIYRSVNIGLVNEMKVIADGMGLDIHEIINAASTKPFGFVPYQPGPGIGGHCIPINPIYLTWKAKKYGLDTRLIDGAVVVNKSMPNWVFHKIKRTLADRGQMLQGSRVLVLGVTYKRDVADTRGSPSLELMTLLDSAGAEVNYSDPYIPSISLPDRTEPYLNVTLSPKTISEYQCLVLATDHSSFDYDLIEKQANLIVDTRGVYLEPSEKVTKA